MANVSQNVGATGTVGVTSTVMPWASRRRRFAANVRALELRDAVGAGLVKAAAGGLERYELYQAGDGNFQVRDKVGVAWLGGLANHRAAEGLWQFDRTKTPMPFPIVFEGLGFGWLFLHVLKTTEKTYVNYSCAAYVVEGDPLALAMLFHMHDLQEVIGAERVRWFVRENGENALAAFREGVMANDGWTVPEQFVRCALRAGAGVAVEGTIKQLQAERAKRREAWLAESASYYAAKDQAYWAKRYTEAAERRGEKLRVLGITSRYTTVLQHSMVEMKAAVEDWGAEMQVSMEPDDCSVENPFPRMIAEFKPDLIFQISRMRYENPWAPKNVPFLCWDQDNLPCMRTPEATLSVNGLTFVAGHGAIFGYGELGWPRENVIFCHPAGATFRYSRTSEITAEETARYGCDISFVSNASGRPEEMREQLRRRWEGDAATVFERASGVILARMDGGATWEYEQLQELARESAAACGGEFAPRILNEMAMALAAFADRCFRHAALHWVRRWCQKEKRSFRIYGKGWSEHADFAAYAAGPAAQGEELAAIYRASRINLQLIEGGFLHSRALDGLAAGGCFITRPAPNDGRGTEVVHAMSRLSSRAMALGLKTRRNLEASTDAEVLSATAVLRRYVNTYALDAEIRGLAAWCEVPHAEVIFPQLPAISFRNEAELGEVAARFLGDDDLRKRLTGEMRELVLREMSYRRRWEKFLGEITRSLTGKARD